MSADKKLINAVDLSVTFKVPSGSLRAVDTVSFYVNAGETVAIDQMTAQANCGSKRFGPATRLFSYLFGGD